MKKKMTKYYNKDIPTEIHVVYGGRQSGKTYYELKKLKERIKELEDYKKRIDKAIEYVKEHKSTNPHLTSLLVDSEIKELEKILKGEENDKN